MSSVEFTETLWRDILYTLRMMRKNPAFTLTAVLTLALGIGANTALFTVVRAVLLRPLKYRDPGRLVHVSEGGATLVRFEEMLRFEEMPAAARAFTELGAFAAVAENVALSGADGPETLKGARVSANFLRILGVEPAMGRGFLPEEDTHGAAPVAMISAELWRRRFGGDPLIAGRRAVLGALPYTIVGVLPLGFQFPFPGVDVWVTRPSEWSGISPQSYRRSPILSVFGRLKPRVTIQQASAELTVMKSQYAIAHPDMLDSKPNSIERATPLKDALVADVRPMLWMLFGVVGFVLLIACANLASLLLGRAASRSREFAVRAALGATRGQLMQQLMAESLPLAFVGGGLGVLLAKWSLSGITSMTALSLPRVGEIRLDALVLGFCLMLSIVTGVLFGLVPALGASRPDLARVLRVTGEGADSGSRRATLGIGPRGLLVVGQVALSIVLLIGATLLVQSLARLYRVDPGFRPADVLTMRIALPPARYDSDRKKEAFYGDLVQRVESLPGVRAAAVTLTLPMAGVSFGIPVQAAGLPPLPLNQRPIATLQLITPAYFRTLHIPLRRGREFTQHDVPGGTPVVLISEDLGRRFWPAYPNGQDPVGQYVLIGASPEPAQIVGIVGDIRQAGLASDPGPGLYRPCAQNPPQSAMFAVRTEGDPLRFVNAVRGQVLAIDRDQPVSAVQTMDDLMEASEGQRRLAATLLGGFAGAALLLAVVGIYGVIAYSVAQRMKEMGIRRALGARRGDILRLVLSQALGLTLGGVAIGVGGAFALTRVLNSLLFHVSGADPATFIGVSLLFVLVALAAGYIPARRATRIDPLAALR